MKENTQIEHLPEDASLEQIITVINQIIDKLGLNLSEVDVKHITDRAVDAIKKAMAEGLSKNTSRTIDIFGRKRV